MSTYYIKIGGNDNLDGLSDANAWATIGKVNAMTFAPGDTILFKRGDTFNDYQIIPDDGSSENPITYGAYGAGDKPKIQLTDNSKSSADAWEVYSGNIWATKTAYSLNTVDIGNVFVNGGNTVLRKESAPGDVGANGDFYWTLGKLYIYSSGGNPGTIYSDIEAVYSAAGINGSSVDYITFENLNIRRCADHGMFFANCTNVNVRDCDFEYLGGGNFSGRRGNGVEFWDSGVNNTVERCTFDNIYDAACTAQGTTASKTFDNITFKNNIITNCGWAFEFWHRDNTSTTDGVYFVNNTCVNNGSSWAVGQRWGDEKGYGVLIFSNTATTSDVLVKNNIFYGATLALVRFEFAADITEVSLDYNNYYVVGSEAIGTIQGTDYATLAAWQGATIHDSHSVDDNPLYLSSTNFHLQATSPCINVGETLVNVTDDYDGQPRPIGANYDIGAYEHLKGRRSILPMFYK